jgi:serine/threonine protein phosphatase PrpC
MAVADGHGGSAYTRSDVGSFLALQAASESINRFIMYVADATEQYPDNWLEMVIEDFSGRFGKMLVSNWVRMVEAHANEKENDQDEIIKLYGTTISVALVVNDCIFIGRIGDSSIFVIVDQNNKCTAKNPFEADDAENEATGLETASLSSREAHRKWQVQTLPLDEIKMILLATDGFTDSFKDIKEEIKNFYLEINKKGVANFEQVIDDELKQITQNGVGDDISLVIFLCDHMDKV